MSSVKLWAFVRGYKYLYVGDELFDFAKEYCREPFTKVTRSDICRLQLIRKHLATGLYEAVYWVDSDVLVWNRQDFKLPVPKANRAACAREVFKMNDWSSGLLTNNSVVGFSSLESLDVLISCSEQTLDSWDKPVAPRMTIIGTDLFSSRKFPLKQTVLKMTGCLSERSIDHILGQSGYEHLWLLSLAHGTELCAANLCSSRERDDERMLRLIEKLTHIPPRPLDEWKYVTPLYRTWLRAVNFPDRIRCWLWSKQIKLRSKIVGLTPSRYVLPHNNHDHSKLNNSERTSCKRRPESELLRDHVGIGYVHKSPGHAGPS